MEVGQLGSAEPGIKDFFMKNRRGIGMGAAVGAGYGMFSEDTSMLGGAFQGAALTALGMGLFGQKSAPSRSFDRVNRPMSSSNVPTLSQMSRGMATRTSMGAPSKNIAAMQRRTQRILKTNKSRGFAGAVLGGLGAMARPFKNCTLPTNCYPIGSKQSSRFSRSRNKRR